MPHVSLSHHNACLAGDCTTEPENKLTRIPESSLKLWHILLQVRVAQQAGDAACLAHALAALCGLLAAASPPPPAAGAPPPPPHLCQQHQLRRLLHL